MGADSGSDGDDSESIDLSIESNGVVNVRTATSELSMLERLVRTHAVWYMPTASRDRVVELLMPQQPGVFIVRGSSKAQAAGCMALSVRYAQGKYPVEIDHYLIETCPGGLLRVEGSQRTFRALPFLLEHYWMHGDELHVSLRLPEPLQSCSRRQDLVSIATLKKDFWSSTICRRYTAHSGSSLPQPNAKHPIMTAPHVQPVRRANTDLHTLPRRSPTRPDPSMSPISELTGNSAARELLPEKQTAPSKPIRPKEPQRVTMKAPENNKTITDPLSQMLLHREKSDLAARATTGRTSQQLQKLRTWLTGSQNRANGGVPTVSSGMKRSASLHTNAKSGKSPVVEKRIITELGAVKPDNLHIAENETYFAPARLSKRMGVKTHAAATEHQVESSNNSHSLADLLTTHRIDTDRNAEVFHPPWATPMSSRRSKTMETFKPSTDAVEDAGVAPPKPPIASRLPKVPVAPRISPPLSAAAAASRLLPSKQRSRSDSTPPCAANLPANWSRDVVQRREVVVDENREGVDPETNCQWVSVAQEMKQRSAPRRISSRISTQGGVRESEYVMLSEIQTNADVCAQQSSAGEVSDDTRSVQSVISHAGTVFNEPWDSACWEGLLGIVGTIQPPVALETAKEEVVESNVDTTIIEEQSADAEPELSPQPHSDVGRASDTLCRPHKASFCTSLREFTACVPPSSSASEEEDDEDDDEASVPSPQLLRRRRHARAIQRYVESQTLSTLPWPSCALVVQTHSLRRGAERQQSTFGATVAHFIQCTREARKTTRARDAMRNVRQFMSGIKNYLVKHGGEALHEVIEAERSQLMPNEFLNIDAILEGALHKIVLRPLKAHLCHLLIKEHSKSGALKSLSDNLTILRNHPFSDFGSCCDSDISPPSLLRAKEHLRRMQHHYSPLKKLDSLLHALNCVCALDSSDLPSAENLVSWLTLLITRTACCGIEIEADYMWALLPPALLQGSQASYYLAALSSAIRVLRHPEAVGRMSDSQLGLDEGNMSSSMLSCSESAEDLEGFVRVAVPDEIAGSIDYQLMPVLPDMTTKKVCKMIAQKIGISNPEDYGLYLLVNGFETLLIPNEYPSEIQSSFRDTANEVLSKQQQHAQRGTDTLRSGGTVCSVKHLFAYKRHDAKIAWPRSVFSDSPLDRSRTGTLTSTLSGPPPIVNLSGVVV